MNRIVRLVTWLMVITNTGVATAQVSPPEPCGPVPSAKQLRWQQMEMYAFIHYSLNTYTDQEWGYGDESPTLFNPSDLDCRQWVKVCKQTGMRGIILTAKHHCGFCLWPSAYTDYSVAHSPWRDPKGSIEKPVHELKAFAKTRELKPGEQQVLTMQIPVRMLASFDEQNSQWLADGGLYEFHVGASSRDIRCTATVKVGEYTEKVSNALAPKARLNVLRAEAGGK